MSKKHEHPGQQKKPLYTGDPNATMTMCAKKLRRHLPHDVQIYVMPALQPDVVDRHGERMSEEAIKEAGLDKPTYLAVCRHCKQHPYLGSHEAVTPPTTSV